MTNESCDVCPQIVVTCGECYKRKKLKKVAERRINSCEEMIKAVSKRKKLDKK